MRYAELLHAALRAGAVVVGALVLVVVLPAPAGAQLDFAPGVVNVSSTPGTDSRMPHMALDPSGVLHVVWTDDFAILYKRSTDQGQHFSAPIQISTGFGSALRPRVAVFGGAVYVAWMEDTSDTKDILFSRSLNGGQTFEPPRNLSNTAEQSRQARVAVNAAGTVFVVWDEGVAPPARHIMMRRSFDGGASFDPARPVQAITMTDADFTNPENATYPGIAIDQNSGRVYLVWHDLVDGRLQVRFSRSLDGGNTFSAPLTLSAASALFHAHCATLTVGPSGRILVAWENRKQADPHTHDATFAQSVDGGLTFSAPVNLSNGPSWAISDYPWPAEGPAGTIVVGWEDNTGGGGLDAVLAVSTNGGASFGPPMNLSNNPGSTSTEVVTLFGPDGRLYVAWEDYASGTGEILLRRATGPTPPPPPPPPPGGGFTGGVYVGSADLTGDGIGDILTGADAGGGAHVRAFSGTSGALAPSFFAYAAAFAGGVRVAACDVDGDGRPEIIVAPGAGGGPHVRVFAVSPTQAAPLAEIASFFAYSAGFTGGVYVACGDLDGDSRPEIVTGPGEGGGPHVRAFRYAPGAPGGVVDAGVGFLAYAPQFTGGVRVAVGDVNGDGRADIITAPGPGGGPHIRVFSGANPAVELAGFFAYAPGFTGGVFVAAGDLDSDGIAEVVTGPGPGGGPHVRVVSILGGVVTRASFFAYDPAFTGGVRVAVARQGSGGMIVTAPGPGGGPHIQVFTPAGIPTGASFFAY